MLGDAGDLRAIASLPDGRVVTAGWDARVRVWPTTTAGDDDSADDGFRQSVSIGPAMAALRDGQIIFDSEGQASAWHPSSPAEEFEFTGRSGAFLCVVAVLADGRALIVTDEGTRRNLGSHRVRAILTRQLRARMVRLSGPRLLPLCSPG